MFVATKYITVVDFILRIDVVTAKTPVINAGEGNATFLNATRMDQLTCGTKSVLQKWE